MSEVAFCFILTYGFIQNVIRTWFTILVLTIVITFITIIAVAAFNSILILLLLSLWLCWCSSCQCYWCCCDCHPYCNNFCSIVVIITSFFFFFLTLICIIMFSMLPLFLILSFLLFYCHCFFVVLANAIIGYHFLLISLLLHGCGCDHYYRCQSGCCYYYCSY